MNIIFKIFLLLTLLSLTLFLYLFYQDQQFKNNPLSQEILTKLNYKNNIIKQTIKNRYNIEYNIPVIISDNLPNNLYGLASYQQGDIKIQLNKKRFQENENYMIEYVLPHEYAHTLMFHFGKFDRQNGGHTKLWQQICFDIGGIKCDRFVNHNDILIEKIGDIY
jgi:hypothetical protein